MVFALHILLQTQQRGRLWVDADVFLKLYEPNFLAKRVRTTTSTLLWTTCSSASVKFSSANANKRQVISLSATRAEGTVPCLMKKRHRTDVTEVGMRAAS